MIQDVEVTDGVDGPAAEDRAPDPDQDAGGTEARVVPDPTEPVVVAEPEERVVRPLPRVIAVANQKGGVGKTTTTVNLGAALAELDYRVLVVDLDPQGNATTGLGINSRTLEHTMYDVLLHDVPIEDCIEPTRGEAPLRRSGQPGPGGRRDRAGAGRSAGRASSSGAWPR